VEPVLSQGVFFFTFKPLVERTLERSVSEARLLFIGRYFGLFDFRLFVYGAAVFNVHRVSCGTASIMMAMNTTTKKTMTPNPTSIFRRSGRFHSSFFLFRISTRKQMFPIKARAITAMQFQVKSVI
jgi:hypothetical protein